MDVYHAISDENRRRILDLLYQQQTLRAGDIVDHLSHITQPAVSKHLRILRQAGLVRQEAQGRERWYRLNPGPLHEISLWIGRYETLWDSRLAQLKQIAEATPQAQSPAPSSTAPQVTASTNSASTNSASTNSATAAGETEGK